jgi:hypothetical protein
MVVKQILPSGLLCGHPRCTDLVLNFGKRCSTSTTTSNAISGTIFDVVNHNFRQDKNSINLKGYVVLATSTMGISST